MAADRFEPLLDRAFSRGETAPLNFKLALSLL